MCKIKIQCQRMHTCIIQPYKCKKMISTNIKIEATFELRKGPWLGWDTGKGSWGGGKVLFLTLGVWWLQGVPLIIIHRAICLFFVTLCICILFYEDKQIKKQKQKNMPWLSRFSLWYECQKPILKFKSNNFTFCS